MSFIFTFLTFNWANEQNILGIRNLNQIGKLKQLVILCLVSPLL